MALKLVLGNKGPEEGVLHPPFPAVVTWDEWFFAVGGG